MPLEFGSNSITELSVSDATLCERSTGLTTSLILILACESSSIERLAQRKIFRYLKRVGAVAVTTALCGWIGLRVVLRWSRRSKACPQLRQTKQQTSQTSQETAKHKRGSRRKELAGQRTERGQDELVLGRESQYGGGMSAHQAVNPRKAR